MKEPESGLVDVMRCYDKSVLLQLGLLCLHYVKQERWATAKMTARCALYMGSLKNFESPWIRPRLLFTTFLMGFCSDRSC